MKRSTETREVISLIVGGMCLRGTYHRSQASFITDAGMAGPTPRIGILFPNSGVLPRAATGDSAVYWADSFARCGYPSFRFDLQGLGDSEGHAPERVLDFLARVNSGSYAPQVSAITKGIVDRFDLSAVVLVAHCAGTVSAVLAAAACNEVRGLVLLEPYFHLQEFKLQRGSMRVQGDGLPSNANLPLIACWQGLESRGIPMLTLTARAPSLRGTGGEFDYVSYLQSNAHHKSRMVVRAIEGTSHSFAEGPGKEGVRKHVEQWLQDWFPLTYGGTEISKRVLSPQVATTMSS